MADTDEASPAPSGRGRAPENGGWWSTKRVVLVILLVLILLAIVGVLWWRFMGPGSGGGGTTDIQGQAIAADVSVDGEPLPAFEGIEDPSQDPAIGMPAPALEGTGLDGEPLAITPGEGPPTVLLFVSHKCSVCADMMEQIQQAAAEGRLPKEVRLVAVSTGVQQERDNYPPGDWFRDLGWTLPTLIDNEKSNAAAVYGLRSYPLWVFIQDDGAVVGRLSGTLAMEDLRTLMSQLASRQAGQGS